MNSYTQGCGGMADTPDLGSGAERYTSSSLVSPTKVIQIHIGTTLGLMAVVWLGHDWIGAVHNFVVLTEITILLFAMFTQFLLWTQLKVIQELEEYTTICAWCQKVRYNGEFIPIDRWIDIQMEGKTTHGICKNCHDNAMHDLSVL